MSANIEAEMLGLYADQLIPFHAAGGLDAVTTAIIVAGTVLGVCLLLLALAGALAIALVRRKLKQKVRLDSSLVPRWTT